MRVSGTEARRRGVLGWCVVRRVASLVYREINSWSTAKSRAERGSSSRRLAGECRDSSIRISNRAWCMPELYSTVDINYPAFFSESGKRPILHYLSQLQNRYCFTSDAYVVVLVDISGIEYFSKHKCSSWLEYNAFLGAKLVGNFFYL